MEAKAVADPPKVPRRILALVAVAWMLVLVAAAPAVHAAANPVVLGAETGRVDLAPHIGWYGDPGADAGAGAVFVHLAKGDFKPLPENSPSFGFQDGAFWFHFSLINRNPDVLRWLLVQRYALSDHFDVYIRYPDGRIVHHAGGDALPFTARAIRYRHPNFWISTPVGVPLDVLVRVQSQSSMQVPLSLFSPTAFTETARSAQFGVGLYYGILLALFFYNLVIWLGVRDASYFWYLFHLSAFGFVLFVLNGFGFEMLWPNSAWMAEKSIPLAICLAQIGMNQFARVFLELKRNWRFGDRVALGLIGGFALLGLASIFLPYRITVPIASALVFPTVTWIGIESVVAWRRGYKPARLFLLAWCMFLFGTAMFAALAFGWLPFLFLTEYGVQIGSAMEMLLLSVALAYRYAGLRNENRRIVRESKVQIERRVEQRTGGLRRALMQLERAHSELSESSRRDSLTGVYNRAYFRERLTMMLEHARDDGTTVALAMVDLDHFKQVNDQFGHLVGDECLLRAAQTMDRAVKLRGGVVARFGGEEFVVAIPGIGIDAALDVAEDIRHELHDCAWQHDGNEITIAASIGVHVLDPHGNVPLDEALEAVDHALYRAKSDGRDCVRLSA